MKQIRKYIITSLAMSMIVVLWVLCVDAALYNTERILKTVASIMVYCFLMCLIEAFIKKRLENYFILGILFELILLIVLFFIFGSNFNWYHKGQEYLLVIYAIPVYIVGYFLRLVGIKKDAEEINKRLERRENKKKM